MMEPGSITRLLQDLADGGANAADRLFDRIYGELRAMADRRLGRERPGRRDDAEGLVHEAFVALDGEAFRNRRQLFFAYSQSMQRILVDRARRARALKRGGGRDPMALPDDCGDARPDDRTVDVIRETSPTDLAVDALDVQSLLERLQAIAPREAEVVIHRFFGGLSDEDIAEVVGVDARTVRRDWASARARFAEWHSPTS